MLASVETESMAIDYEFDDDSSRLTIRVTDRYDDREMMRALEAIVADERFRPGIDILSDHLELKVAMSAGQFIKFVDFFTRKEDRIAGSRYAVVTVRALAISMVRMIATVARAIPVEVRTFSTVEAAERWLASGRPTRP